MSSPEQTTSSTLAARYGTPKRRLSHRAKVVLAVAVLVVVVAGLAVFGATRGNPPMDSKTIGYNVLDPTMTTVDFRVSKDRTATIQCAVETMNASHAVVGWKVVTIGPNPASAGRNDGRTTAHRTKVRTTSKASSGRVDACWLAQNTD